MSVIIRLQGLPWSANALDIRRYFQGLIIPEGGVHIVGGEMGDAFIAFATDEDARQAMLLDGGKIKEVRLKLFLSSRTEMQKVIEMARNQSLGLPAVAAPPPQQAVMQPQKPAMQMPQPMVIDGEQNRSPEGPERRDGANRRDRHERSRDRSRDRSRERDRGRRRRSRSRTRSPRRSRDRDRDSKRKDDRSRRGDDRNKREGSRKTEDKIPEPKRAQNGEPQVVPPDRPAMPVGAAMGAVGMPPSMGMDMGIGLPMGMGMMPVQPGQGPSPFGLGGRNLPESLHPQPPWKPNFPNAAPAWDERKMDNRMEGMMQLPPQQQHPGKKEWDHPGVAGGDQDAVGRAGRPTRWGREAEVVPEARAPAVANTFPMTTAETDMRHDAFPFEGRANDAFGARDSVMDRRLPHEGFPMHREALMPESHDVSAVDPRNLEGMMMGRQQPQFDPRMRDVFPPDNRMGAMDHRAGGDSFALGNRDGSLMGNREAALMGNRDPQLMGNRDAGLMGSHDTGLMGNRDVGLMGNRDAGLMGNRDAGLMGNRDAGLMGNRDAGLMGNRDAGLMGNRNAGLLGNRDAGLLGNRDAGLLGNRDAGFMGNRDAGLMGNRDAGLLGSRDAGPLGSRDTGLLGNRGAGLLGNRDPALMGNRDASLMGNRDPQLMSSRGRDPPPMDNRGRDPPPMDNRGRDHPSMDNRGRDPPPMDNRGRDPPPMDNRGRDPPPMDNRGRDPPPLDNRGRDPPPMDNRARDPFQAAIKEPLLDSRNLHDSAMGGNRMPPFRRSGPDEFGNESAGPRRPMDSDSRVADFRGLPGMPNGRMGVPPTGDRFDDHGPKPPSRSPGTCVELRGVPWSVSIKAVIDFFRNIPLSPSSVKLIRDERGSKVLSVIVRFANESDRQEGMKRSKSYIGSRYVEVFPCHENLFDSNGAFNGPVEAKSPITNPEDNTNCILVKGLPYNFKEDEFEGVFEDMKVVNSYVEYDSTGEATGNAFVEFTSIADAKKAVNLKTKIGHRYLTFCLVGKERMVHAMGGGKVKKDVDRKESGASSDWNRKEQARIGGEWNKKDQTDCCLVKGLPFSATDRDIVDFFSAVGVMPITIHIMLTKSGQPSGDAFCEFKNPLECEKGLQMNTRFMGNRFITVLPVPRSEMNTSLGLVQGVPPQDGGPILDTPLLEHPSMRGIELPLDAPPARGMDRHSIDGQDRPPRGGIDRGDPLDRMSSRGPDRSRMDRPPLDRPPRGMDRSRVDGPPFNRPSMRGRGRNMEGMPMDRSSRGMDRSPLDSSLDRSSMRDMDHQSGMDGPPLDRPPRSLDRRSGMDGPPLDRPSRGGMLSDDRRSGSDRGSLGDRPHGERPGLLDPPPIEKVNLDMGQDFSGSVDSGPPGGLPPGFGEPGAVLGARNFPYRATVDDVLKFFQGFGLTNENILRRFNERGQPTGECRVAFSSPADALRALREHNNRLVQGRPVTLFMV